MSDALLDKGHRFTPEISFFDYARFKLYLQERRESQVLHRDIVGFSDYEVAEYEKVYKKRKNNLHCINHRIRVGTLRFSFCYFLTITFNDEFLNSTTAKYRRTYIGRFLKNNFESYVANIDFGDRNQREHYHAICFSSMELEGERKVILDVNGQRHFYINAFTDVRSGYVSVEKVYDPKLDISALSKYMLKLKFHSTKQSTRFQRPIFSRL